MLYIATLWLSTYSSILSMQIRSFAICLCDLSSNCNPYFAASICAAVLLLNALRALLSLLATSARNCSKRCKSSGAARSR